MNGRCLSHRQYSARVLRAQVKSVVLVCVAVYAVCVPSCRRAHERASLASLLDQLAASAPSLGHSILIASKRRGDIENGIVTSRHPWDHAPESSAGRLLQELRARSVGEFPELASLLRDPGRRSVAAYALAEIGGVEAAKALWREYEPLLRRAQRRVVYVKEQGQDGKLLERELGYRYANVDEAYYKELFHGLARSGSGVAAQVLTALAHSLSAMEALPEEIPLIEEDVVRDGRHFIEVWTGIDEYHRCAELVMLVGWIAPPGATQHMNRALGARQALVRLVALDAARWMGDPGTVPAIVPFLSDESPYGPDMRVCDAAVETIAMARSSVVIRMDKLSPEQRNNRVEWYKREFGLSR